ncbi:MAG: class I SAM-dependent methyltransferase [Candidatus Aenigmarchaeota archaeon]|nr:class I SAM-dependent methyltransferase [Candidatus Aenigmarchaeota archaeon]
MFSHVYGSWRSVQKEKFEKIFARLGSEFINTLESKLVIDIGAGSGYLEEFLQEKGIDTKNITALEPDRKMIKQNRGKAHFVLGKAEQLPFRENSFDAAFIFDAIHLFQDRNFIEVVKPEGMLILTIFFNDSNYYDKRKILHENLSDCVIVDEFSIATREKELVAVAKKK